MSASITCTLTCRSITLSCIVAVSRTSQFYKQKLSHEIEFEFEFEFDLEFEFEFLFVFMFEVEVEVEFELEFEFVLLKLTS